MHVIRLHQHRLVAATLLYRVTPPNITDIATEERIGILSLLMSIFLVFDSESYHSSDSEVGYNDDLCGAQWLDSTTDDRVVAGSNPTRDASNRRQVRYPMRPVSFG